MDFKCYKNVALQITTVTIEGYINEHAKFPEIAPAPAVLIDLKGVTGLNSVGTRNWLLWVKSGLPDTPISVTFAPPLFVKMFGEVQGTLSARISVDSFYVPYYSDETGERQDVLFERGKNYDSSGHVSYPDVKDSEGHLMEIDVLPHFFQFLKGTQRPV